VTAHEHRFPIGVPYYIAEVRVTYLARSRDAEGLMVFEAWVPPGGGPPPLHAHEGGEFFYTLEGQLSYFRRDGDSVTTMTGGPGTSGYVPREVPHTYRNLSLEPGRFLGVVIPAEAQEGFFDEAGVPVGPDGTPSATVDNETMMAISERWGLQWFAPPPGTA
jgi:mannose-6-phosphate isomerase-like protein (cupin superfamily)